MFKFRKDDAGLYVASVLIGGGVGFLVGSFIASRRNRTNDTEVWDEFDMKEEEAVIKQPLGEKKVKQAAVKEVEEPMDPDVLRLIETYTVSPVHLQLLQQKIITIEELELALIKSTESTNYARSFDYDDDKPDLGNMVKPPQDHGLFDGRNMISTEPFPKVSRSKYQQVFFDPMDESYSMAHGKDKVLPWSGSGLIGDDTWVTIYNYLQAGVEPLYVHNTSMAKYFCFQTIPDDALDTLEEYPDKDGYG